MDKLLEILVNFLLLSVGLVAVLRSGLLAGAGSLPYASVLALAALAAWPFIHITLLYRRIYPLSAVVRGLSPGISQTLAVRFVRVPPSIWLGSFAGDTRGAVFSAVRSRACCSRYGRRVCPDHRFVAPRSSVLANV